MEAWEVPDTDNIFLKSLLHLCLPHSKLPSAASYFSDCFPVLILHNQSFPGFLWFLGGLLRAMDYLWTNLQETY